MGRCQDGGSRGEGGAAGSIKGVGLNLRTTTPHTADSSNRAIAGVCGPEISVRKFHKFYPALLKKHTLPNTRARSIQMDFPDQQISIPPTWTIESLVDQHRPSCQ